MLHRICFNYTVVTSAKEIMVSSLFGLTELVTLRKNFRMDLYEIFREGWQWPMNK